VSETSIFSYLEKQLRESIGEPRYHQSVCKSHFALSMERAEKLGGAMIAFGLKRRDAVALVMPNTESLIVSLLAVIGIGAIAVPLPTLVSEEDLAELLHDCRAKLIITTDADVLNIVRVTAQTQSRAAIVSTNSDCFEGIAGFEEFLEMNGSTDLTARGADALLVYKRNAAGSWESVMLGHSAFIEKILTIGPSIYQRAL
jgi:acyl-CoA synthetase (AMP-forming)/AMP-acid ligase II